jgi:hypothetical protein
MKDISIYFELKLHEIGAYCPMAIKVRHIWYAIEYIFLAKHIKKVYISYFRYKTTFELVKKSNNG